LNNQAGEQIIPAPGGKTDDEMDGPVRVVSLCARIAGKQCPKQ
jgi:hypothetical protein